MQKKYLGMICLLILASMLIGCGNAAQTRDVYRGINVASPDWVGKLDAAEGAEQLLIVAAFSEDATDAWVSLHQKQSDGSWHMIMTSPGFIGKNGLGKTRRQNAGRRFPFQPCFRHCGRSGLRDPLCKSGQRQLLVRRSAGRIPLQ